MTVKLNEEYYLRGLQESDADGPYPDWFEDQDVCAFNSHGKFLRTKGYYRDYVRRLNGSEMVVWAVCHVEDGHIGNVSLQNMSFINRNAEFAILLGDRRHWGKGIGKMVGDIVLKHGFYKLNLHRIHCGVASNNIAMLRLASALGMKEEGRRRQQLFLNNDWVDVVEFGMLKSEFFKTP